MMMRGNLAAVLGVSIALVGYLAPAVAQTCSNGLEGIESTSFDVCCSPECTTCGGTGCALQNTTNGAADCCVTEIIDSGILCDDQQAAPCIITIEPANNFSVCENGMTGVQDPNTDVCCPLICGYACGGVGCGSIAGASADDCCAQNVMNSGVLCSNSGEPPCLITAETTVSNSTCSNGFAGVEDTTGSVCCSLECGQCGGSGCGTLPGLTGDQCCSTNIESSGQLCEDTGSAPCVLPAPEFTPSMCPNGIPGVQDGMVCCAEECNLQCGGEGCGSIAGTNGASDCCSSTILETGVECGEGVSAPCIMQNGTYTDAPTTAPLVPDMTPAPTPGSRDFSMAPTQFGQTMAPTMVGTIDEMTGVPTPSPTSDSRGGFFGSDVPTPSPFLIAGSAAPTSDSREIPTGAPTMSPMGTAPPTETGAGSQASVGHVITVLALVAGGFAMHAAARD